MQTNSYGQPVRLTLAMLLSVCMLTSSLSAQKEITASEAKNHIGETATVCGTVASTRFAASTKGQPTFLNLDQPYPNQIFTVLIWGSDRSKFGRPEVVYQSTRICATGKISSYRGTAEIVVNDPSQLRVETRNVGSGR
jgi:DNA/RNA endonuclease YhcR with UshA esterase domain